MEKLKLIITILIISLLLNCIGNTNYPKAEKGVIDFNTWNFKTDGNAKLNGEWEFYWDKIISPNDFLEIKPDINTNYREVPKNWTTYKINNKKLPENGIATYRLKIDNLKNQKYALLINRIASFNLLVNDTLIYDGESNKTKDGIVTKPLVNVFSVSPINNSLDVIIQIDNKMFFKYSGLSIPVELGLEKNIIFKKSWHLIIRAFLIGIFIMAAFYNTSFFLFRKKDVSFLYFSLFCILIALHTALMKEQLFLYIFRNISAHLYYKILYIISFLFISVYMSFFYSIHKNFMNKKLTQFYIFSGITLAGFAVLIDPKYILPFLSPLLVYEAIIFSAIIYICYTYVKVIQAKKNGALYELAGVFCFFSSVLVYIAFERVNADASFIMPFGLTLYIIFQTFLLSHNYSRSIESQNQYLQRINNLKDEFLARTTHELRTPLNGIIGIAESLCSGAAGNISKKINDNLSLIISSGKRLSNIINDILDFSKLKNSDIKLHRKTVDIKVVSDIVITVLKKLIYNKDIQIINIMPGNIPYVFGDENRLIQILYNLIGNAIKFTNSGYITVNAQRKGEFIEVSIADTGVGIAKDKLELIFNSFEQANSTIEAENSGCGLGLSITKKLVELHKGEIRVYSEPENGSTFFFTIPICKTGILDKSDNEILSSILEDQKIQSTTLVETDKNSESLISIISDKPVNILVVDDEPINLQVMINYLAFDNFNVYSVQDGESALNLLKEKEIDLILLDIMMPLISGYELCKMIREKHSSSELPIILVTAKNRISDLIQGFNSGANDYITKPFLKDELLVRIQTQLKIRDAYKTLKENLELKAEITERIKKEEDLRITQQKLSGMLNTVDEAVITVNRNEEFTFINRSMEHLCGFKFTNLLGQSIDKIIMNNDIDIIKSLKDDIKSDLIISKRYPQIKIQSFDMRVINADLILNKLKFGEDSLSVLIFNPVINENQLPDVRNHLPDQMGNFISELNKNTKRMEIFEKCLDEINLSYFEKSPALTNYLENIDETLKQLKQFLDVDKNDQKKNIIAVKLINSVLDYWKINTNKSKVDLARMSGLWTVYSNLDGWERTQTFDKYLSIEKFPKSPNWKKIIDTVEFVLQNCENVSHSKERNEICDLFKVLKKMI